MQSDNEGVVFGRPDQVELDVIIKNGLLLIGELKSSIDKAGMYIFERKARKVAEQLGIELYSDADEVETL